MGSLFLIAEPLAEVAFLHKNGHEVTLEGACEYYLAVVAPLNVFNQFVFVLVRLEQVEGLPGIELLTDSPETNTAIVISHREDADRLVA